MKMTTIELSEKTKQGLDKFKKEHESFDTFLDRLRQRLEDEASLAQAYRENAAHDKQVAKEWFGTVSELTPFTKDDKMRSKHE
ncbi:MAG: hypothetical protein OXR66_08840 [Candidatus Woesearchaeota archaeon]|nr:hypothetical protein [Candidatus Woesearchaeota archaeon]